MLSKQFRSTLLAILASITTNSHALYPDVDSMLEALRPTAPVDAPELNTLILALDAIPTEQARRDALETLIPTRDGSLRTNSETMHQFHSVLFERLVKVKKAQTGVNSGDAPETPNVKESNKQESVETKKETKKDTQAEKQKQDKQEQKQNKDEAKKEDSKEQSQTPTVTAAQDHKESEPENLNKAVWMHILGENVGQKIRENVPGYDAEVLGLIIGRDVLMNPNYTIGLAMGYQYADVKQRNLSGSNQGIKRFQGTLYGAYEFNIPFFIHAAFSVALNNYDNHRHILVPPYGGTPIVHIANRDFWGHEIDAYLEAGYKYQNGGFIAIPKLILGYTHLVFNSYIEDDAFGYDLDVKYNDIDSLPLGAGIKIAYQNEFENAFVTPEMHANFFHDFIGDKQTATALFTGGGFEFLSQGASVGKNTIDVGAGIEVNSYTDVQVIIQYDYVARSDYHKNSALIRVRYEWA